MYRKHMTEEQLRQLKHTQRCHFHNGIRVEWLYPQVEQIEIHYEKRHISFLGETHQEGTRVIKPNFEGIFRLPEGLHWNGTIVSLRIPYSVPNFNYTKYIE